MMDLEAYYRTHLEVLTSDLGEIASGNSKLHVPLPSINFVRKLASDISQIFEHESTLLELQGPIYIVGDLHGHLLDLYRILTAFGVPPATKYLFLGDYVDRGEFSMETLFLVYSMKCLFPDHVFMIRGNHEFKNISLNGGLFREVEHVYPKSDAFDVIVDSFQFMPLAARISNEILCVHGGLGPHLSRLSQIIELQRPIQSYEDPILCGLLWSDPSEKTDTFMSSPRGTGFVFGERAVRKFLKTNGLRLLIRGHECVKTGCSFKFHDQVLTVFSASNYCGVTDNKAGVVFIDAAGKEHTSTFRPYQYLKRKDVIMGRNVLPPLCKTMRMVVPAASFDRQTPRRGFETISLASMRPDSIEGTFAVGQHQQRFYLMNSAGANLIRRRTADHAPSE